MRVLVTVNDAVGHVLPVVPTLRTLVEQRHEVLLACPGASTALLSSLDVPTRRFDSGDPEIPLHVEGSSVEERLRFAAGRRWPAAARGWARQLVAEAEQWRPDVLLVEPVEHAGRVAAAALGVPWVEHGWGFGLPADLESLAAEGLSDLYAEFGVDVQPPRARVDLGPVSLQPDDASPDITRYRYHPWAPPAPPLPDPGERPRVLVTVGTMHHDATARLENIARAAAEVGAEVVVAGGGADAGSARWPPGTHVAEWLHMPSELARCRAVVHHGGAGTAYAAIDAGVPAVCLPQFGDQFRNARMLASAGVCLTADPDATSEEVRSLLGRVLESDSIRDAVRRLGAENRALPGCEALVAHVADVAARG